MIDTHLRDYSANGGDGGGGGDGYLNLTVMVSPEGDTFPSMASLRVSCFGQWNPPHHMLFQLAHAALLLSFLAPNTTCGFLFLHSMIIVGKYVENSSVNNYNT